jgi:FKBP-type peptidyl-prolyl cis-trans isomerase 2
MSAPEPRTVRMGDTVRLHFRLEAGGQVVDDSFAGDPVTITLGSGELEPRLERWLIGLVPGQRHVFMLEPSLAFGDMDPALIHTLDRADLGEQGDYEPHTLMEFRLPNGQTLAGRILEANEETVKVDFNHPLAGCAVRFEVEILGLE